MGVRSIWSALQSSFFHLACLVSAAKRYPRSCACRVSFSPRLAILHRLTYLPTTPPSASSSHHALRKPRSPISSRPPRRLWGGFVGPSPFLGSFGRFLHFDSWPASNQSIHLPPAPGHLTRQSKHQLGSLIPDLGCLARSPTRFHHH
ncbi:hypothetical protein B0H63DRAFT_481302 [Podospora didyma]|uniref:Secreted protein n=1 Tax=Podospora didyma TaxID=330526 RepID=A0AAE0N983_9PEZI|nr:hypothetical protein B0H63DRAFT_481302 [Podospora didyma]